MKNYMHYWSTLILGVISALITAQDQPTAAVQPSTIGTIFRANYYEYEGKPQQALELYTQLNNTKDNPIYALRTQVRLQHKLNKNNEIVDLIGKLDQHFANDPEIQSLIVEVLDQTRQFQKAADRVKKLQQQFPDHQKIALYTAQLYLNQRNTDKALATINTFIAAAPPRPNNFMFHFFKAQIFLAQNRKKEAITALEDCVALYPHFDKGWILISILKEEAKDLAGAITACSRAAEITDNTMIRQRLLSLLGKKQGAIEQHHLQSNSCYHKALILLEHDQLNEALQQINECLKQQPNNEDARLIKIEILGTMDTVEKALWQLTEWMMSEPSNELWFKTAQLLRQKGLAKQKLKQTFESIAKKHPQALPPLLYLADMQLKSHDNKEAFATLKKITELCRDPKLKAKAYYQIARIYFDQKETTSMLQSLEQGYTCDPDFAPICNMLAYYYAGKGKNLAKAEELIKKALAQDPENPHYLDTAGYMAYKQGDLKKAENIIEPLATAAPHDTVIAGHIHKIHRALTRQNKQTMIAKR